MPFKFHAARRHRIPRARYRVWNWRLRQGSRQRPWSKEADPATRPPFTAGAGGDTGIRCIECGSEAVSERRERTAQGYRRFRCRTCAKQFNERSGTLLNHVQYPSDIVALRDGSAVLLSERSPAAMVLWRLRYKLSLRDLPEMCALRGIGFCHETAREWEAKLTPALAKDLRRRRRGKAGRSWYVDEVFYRRRIQAALARVAKRVTRVLARGRPLSQCTTRETFIAAAVQTC